MCRSRRTDHIWYNRPRTLSEDVLRHRNQGKPYGENCLAQRPAHSQRWIKLQIDSREDDSGGGNEPLIFGHVPEHRNQQRKQTLAGRPFQSCHKSGPSLDCQELWFCRSLPPSSPARKAIPLGLCCSAFPGRRMGSLSSPFLLSASLPRARPSAHPRGDTGSS